ncbi:MAG: replicative DNA helicase [Parcubacteria group bacterium Licking1014_17]|nr:MAG: replicative DNA helicase [Parcubacteria group bacterium Licking1014_17]
MPEKNGKINDQLPPQNIEAEKGLLGALLIDKEAIHRVVDIVDSDNYYSRAHQIIYEAMMRLYTKNEPIDLLTVSNILEEQKQLETIGGTGYLTSLVNSAHSSAHAAHYAKIVERKSILRGLIDSAYEIIRLGYQEETDLENLLDEAEQKLFSVTQKSIQQKFESIGSTLNEAFERLDSLHKGDGVIRGMPTGFADLDNKTAGLQKSNLVILAARPSIGKTSLALDVARHVAKFTPVGIFSLEMSREEVTDRLIASTAGVSLWKMRTGKLSSHGENNDFQKIAVALDELSKSKLFIEDSSTLSVLQMRAMSRRLQAEHGLGLIIVDYLQLITPNQKFDSAVQQVTEISRNLKALARELSVPVLAVSQLSRAVESRPNQRPKLSDLRDSGSIEQDADLVMFIYRDDKVRQDQNAMKTNVAEIIIAKHRNGPTGEVELYFDEESVSFKDLAKNF